MTAIDLLGPTIAAAGVTTRPTETRSFGAADTFFLDCSSPTADDGTEYQASFFNAILANLRSLVRGNGQTAASADIVTQDNTDDSLFLKAVNQLIQRGQPNYAVDTGAANALVIAPTPALAEWKAGVRMFIKAAANNSGPATVTSGALPAINVVRRDGSALLDSDIIAASYQEYFCDGTSLRLQSAYGTKSLTRNVTWYVDSVHGSDTLYDGTSATVSGSHGPFASIQQAANQIPLYNLNGNNININVADGAYGGVIFPQVNGAGEVIITGDLTTGTNVVVTGVNQSAFMFASAGNYVVSGFELTASGSKVGDPISCIAATNGAWVEVGNIAWGASVGAQFYISNGSNGLNIAGCVWNILASAPAFLDVLESGARFLTNPSGGPNFNVVNAVTYSNAFVAASVLAVASLQYAGFTGAGNVSGLKFSANYGAVITSNGGGVNYYPGSVAGTTSPGGQYE